MRHRRRRDAMMRDLDKLCEAVSEALMPFAGDDGRLALKDVEAALGLMLARLYHVLPIEQRRQWVDAFVRTLYRSTGLDQ